MRDLDFGNEQSDTQLAFQLSPLNKIRFARMRATMTLGEYCSDEPLTTALRSDLMNTHISNQVVPQIVAGVSEELASNPWG